MHMLSAIHSERLGEVAERIIKDYRLIIVERERHSQKKG